MSKKIKEWISKGKPSTMEVEGKPEETNDQTEGEEEQKPDKEEAKPKKKRGKFGFFRK